MSLESRGKVTPRHLGRKAYLYVRQSSLRQVFENTESTKRQYALRERAVSLGWAPESVVVIDSDLGQSGASSVDREGFKRLVSEVGMGHAGIVMGLEVSRLARKSSDWHRLLEICALSDTLLLDEDGVYDPGHFNDRLVLGLKGTMSEAELHVLRSRLRGGILNKARRGELEVRLPVGFVYDPEGLAVMDPDQKVRETIVHFFEIFRRTGSAMATVKCFRKEGLDYPRRPRSGPFRNRVLWASLTHSLALRTLHNPRYAGVFFYGRSRSWKDVEGRTRYRKLPREEWLVFLPGAHQGYISLEEYEENQKRLVANSAAFSSERRRGPPREGPALLQGLAVCGRCGQRMGVHYHQRRGRLVPDYVCQRAGIERGEASCERINGGAIDEAVGGLLVETVNPLALEVALAVKDELQTRLEQADELRRKSVERARYEAERKRHRYLQVDPENRLVAATLEAEWNEKLRELADAQEEYERRRREDRVAFGEEERARIHSLASDFPALWKDPGTPMREKKRMAKLLVEDVTILRGLETTLDVRFRGGATRTLRVPAPVPAWKLRQTSPEVVAEIDRLLDQHTDEEVAENLDRRGFRTGVGTQIHRLTVRKVRLAYGLQSRYHRLRERGLLTVQEMSERLGVSVCTVHLWRRQGRLTGYPYDDKGQILYESPGPGAPKKHERRSRADTGDFRSSTPPVR